MLLAWKQRGTTSQLQLRNAKMTSKLHQTAKQFLDQFGTLDVQALESILADNYYHEFAPASINPPGPFDRPGFLNHHGTIRDIMIGFPVAAKEYIVSEASRQVTVWATAETVFRDEAKDGEVSEEEWRFKGEYVFMFTMDESGEKITRTIEFLDSKATADKLMGLMKRARENKQKKLAAETK